MDWNKHVSDLSSVLLFHLYVVGFFIHLPLHVTCHLPDGMSYHGLQSGRWHGLLDLLPSEFDCMLPLSESNLTHCMFIVY